MDEESFRSQSPPQAWIDGLAEGEADVLAGRVSPWPEARARLHALLASLKAAAATTIG
jgi:ABC-type amino acid transport substrate-binding protein